MDFPGKYIPLPIPYIHFFYVVSFAKQMLLSSSLHIFFLICYA